MNGFPIRTNYFNVYLISPCNISFYMKRCESMLWTCNKTVNLQLKVLQNDRVIWLIVCYFYSHQWWPVSSVIMAELLNQK